MRIRLTESRLRSIIRETIDDIVDNYSSGYMPRFDGNLDDPERREDIEDEMYSDDSIGYPDYRSQEDAENDYSWKLRDRSPMVAHEPSPEELDMAMGQRYRHMYGDEEKAQELRDKEMGHYLSGASPDFMAGYHAAQTESVVRRAVRDAINEAKLDSDVENRIHDFLVKVVTKGGYTTDEVIDTLAQIAADNELSAEDIDEYVDLKPEYLEQLREKIEEWKEYNEWEKMDDKRREYEAWAEDRMSDMGFGYEGD